jgi:hypothetical protein
MAKNKVSEWSATPADNTDVGGIDINEGCAPSGINNAIREVMAQVKDMQAGTDGDTFTVGGNLIVSSTLTANSSVGTAGQALLSRGAGLSPQWGAAFVTGMIMIWSGSSASIPSGWLLCDGSSSTPDLRNRFVVGAGSTYAVGATGGSADAITVSHTHTGTTASTSLTGSMEVSANAGLTGNATGILSGSGSTGYIDAGGIGSGKNTSISINASHTHTITTDSTGSSGTNANLPPYYALCYIMKS